MDRTNEARPSDAPPLSTDGIYQAILPRDWRLPLLFASPHSGRLYEDSFLQSSRLDALSIRKSEDCFVDKLFASAPDAGAPLLKALFPRAFVDVNREPFELDPSMFREPLPAWINSHSSRVQNGLGTIARIVANGEPIYQGKLTFAEAEWRIRTCYEPYHTMLQWLIDRNLEKFGYCLLVDCHSMPSVFPIPGANRTSRTRFDFVLGDRHGRACARPLRQRTFEILRREGYRVSLNDPYAGGYTTGHYGRPDRNVHVLQIEINRALYMNEKTLEPHQGMDSLIRRINSLIAGLGSLDSGLFKRIPASQLDMPGA